MKIRTLMLIGAMAISGCKSSKDPGTRARIPHVVLTDKCSQNVSRNIVQRKYSDLKKGLDEMNSLPPTLKKEKAISLYTMKRYHVSYRQAAQYIENLKVHHLDADYAYPLVAILGSLRLTDSTPEKEEGLLAKMKDLLKAGNMLRSQIIFAMGERGKVESVRAKVMESMRGILLNQDYRKDERRAAGQALLAGYMENAGEADIEVGVVKNPRRNVVDFFNCNTAEGIAKLAGILADYLSRESSLPKEKIKEVLKKDFIVILKDPMSLNPRQDRGVVGGFAGDSLLVNNEYDAPWVSAHESVHGLAFHLRMRAVDRNLSEYDKRFGRYTGNPYVAEEIATQQIVNEALADLMGIPLRVVPVFIGNYSNLLMQPEIQAIYDRMVERAGSKERFFEIFFLGSGSEKTALYMNSILDLYGKKGLDAIETMNFKSRDSVRAVLDRLKE